MLLNTLSEQDRPTTQDGPTHTLAGPTLRNPVLESQMPAEGFLKPG